MVTSTILDLLRTASPHQRYSKNLDLIERHFEDAQNQEAFMKQSNLFSRVRGRSSSLPLRSQYNSAKLHCLYGAPFESITRTRSGETYPYAASTVYDIRRYRFSNMWGPFMDDGSNMVDWEKMEAIMIVIRHNTKESSGTRSGIIDRMWSRPWREAVRDSYVSLGPPRIPTEPTLSPADLDPYNVSGTWLRVSDDELVLAKTREPKSLTLA